jgi:hypothetical protein
MVVILRGRCPQSALDGVKHVLFCRHPLKVAGSVVLFVAVFVVDLIGAVRSIAEALCHKAMNQSLHLNAVVSEGYLRIPVPGGTARHATPLAVLAANNIAVRMDKVVGEISDMLFH